MSSSESERGLAESFVRERLIRGDDPRDPAASRNGVKTRVTAAVLIPTLLTFLVLDTLSVPSIVTVAVTGCIGVGLIHEVTATVNEVGDEWTARDEQIRATAKDVDATDVEEADR